MRTTGEVTQTFPGHNLDKIHRWSPDGSLIATSGQDGEIKIWDVDSGYKIFSLRSHPGGASGIS